jgi:peptidoglycan-associated lipoprotein
MSIRLVLVLLFTVMLSGCETTEEKKDDVIIEDQGRSIEEGGTDTQTYGAEKDDRSTRSALDDPNSPLSTRIIYFEYDSSEVQAQYRAVVEAHAAYLVANPNVNITLEGHADERGSREYNLALGERRADSIKRQMSLLGASSQQIRIVSYGEERPAIDGHDEYSWSQNRRAEILY